MMDVFAVRITHSYCNIISTEDMLGILSCGTVYVSFDDVGMCG